jgi:ech hydrogenase subunit A
VPFIGALLCLITKDKVRNSLVCLVCGVVAVCAILFSIFYCSQGACDSRILFNYTSHGIDYVCFGINIALMLVVLGYCIKYKKIIPAVLALCQLGFEVFLEFSSEKAKAEVSYGLSIDMLSIVMVLIIGVIGSGICIYAIGYMQDFQKHEPKDAKDRRSFFMAVCIAFLGAMYLIVFSNDMSWMLCGWEITTVCSFLLIGYTKTEEAIKNSFLQITLNLIGGIAFSVAIYFACKSVGTCEFDQFVKTGLKHPGDAMLPLSLFALAGFTKAAQVPFHTWLLGAMVAPTPTSALLHSSTMVKAGVFLLIKLSPLFAVCQFVGMSVSLLGGMTFLFASIVAISQSNGKRVLAYSTIANLGLITMCAGIGTEIAVWSAVMLLIFHAIAKSMLFLCVGTAEHHVGSRDIESFDLLFDRMPKLARFMMFGIFVMFIAPFGMLIAKWGAMISLIDAKNITLIIFLGFGSAATFAYWAKWLGKLSGITSASENIEGSVTKTEKFVLYLMATLLAVANISLPVFSTFVCDKVSSSLFGTNTTSTSILSTDSLVLCAILAFIVFFILFDVVGRKRKESERELKPYLSGVTVNSDERTFAGAVEKEMQATTRNFYFDSYFGESITPVVQIFGVALIAVSIIYSISVFLG